MCYGPGKPINLDFLIESITALKNVIENSINGIPICAYLFAHQAI